MALVVCKDCQKEFSDDASRCIHCGARKLAVQPKKPGVKFILGVACFIGLLMLLGNVDSDESANQASIENNRPVSSEGLNLRRCYSKHLMQKAIISEATNLSFLNPPSACSDEIQNFVSACKRDGGNTDDCQAQYAALWLVINSLEAPAALIEGWHVSNSLCRDAMDPTTAEVVCLVRKRIGSVLEGDDWCYGKHGQAMYQKQWHRCTVDSNRY